MSERIYKSVDELRVGMPVAVVCDKNPDAVHHVTVAERSPNRVGWRTSVYGRYDNCCGEGYIAGYEARRVRILDEAGAGLSSAAAARERVEHAEERVKGMCAGPMFKEPPPAPRTPQVGVSEPPATWPPRAGVYETADGFLWETAGDGEARLLPNGSDIPFTPLDWQEEGMRFVGPLPEGAAQMDTSRPRTPQVGEWYERVDKLGRWKPGDVARVDSTDAASAFFIDPDGDRWETPLIFFPASWRGPVPAPEAAREVEKPAVQEEARCWDCNAVGPFPLRNVRRTPAASVVCLELCDDCYLSTEEYMATEVDKADTVVDANGKPIGRRIDLERPHRPRTVASMPSGIATGWQRTGWNRRAP